MCEDLFQLVIVQDEVTYPCRTPVHGACSRWQERKHPHGYCHRGRIRSAIITSAEQHRDVQSITANRERDWLETPTFCLGNSDQV